MKSGGRLVLLTGGSAGIGRAAAIRFVENGDRLVVVARNREALESLAKELGEDNCIPFAADLTETNDADALTHLLTGIGTPDVIVANAGIGLDARFAETTDEALERVFDLNVVAVYRTVRPHIDDMVRRGSGRILFVSSIVGKRGIPNYSAYSGSKFALTGIAEALRVELRKTGVTVGVVYPSSTETGFQDHLLREGPGQNRKRLRRHSADSVARAIVKMAGSRRRERVLSLEARFLNIANRLSPAAVDALLARALMRKSDD
ncbi:MAG: SDR family NAD(P)-dependent oxidoreductase [Acidobacteriota bacterium]|nr:SDR family NAD(P)-dependent oxidoreductase [Acidobacteriota bacterium]